MTDGFSSLAKKGRFGDDVIIHVSRKELHGLETILGRPLSINPETGHREAFFFLPFLSGLASLFSAAAPAAATAATAAAPAMAGIGALGAGMKAGMAAGAGLGLAAKAIPAVTEIAANAAPAAAGLTQAATQAATHLAPALAQTALPSAIATGGTIPMGGMGLEGLVSQAAPTAAGTQVAGLRIGLPEMYSATKTGAAPLGISGIGTPASASVPLPKPRPFVPDVSPPPPNLSGVGSPPTSPAVPETAPNVGLPTTAPMPTARPDAAASGGLSDLLGGMDPMQMMMMGSMLMGQGGGKKSDKKDSEWEDAAKTKYSGGDPKFPGKSYNPGTSGEWDYYPKFSDGGIVSLACGGMVKKRKGYASGGVVDPDEERHQKMLDEIDDILPVNASALFPSDVLAQMRSGVLPTGPVNPPSLGGPTTGALRNNDGVIGILRRQQDILQKVGGAIKTGTSAPTGGGGSASVKKFAQGGMVKGYAAGGIADLQPQVSPQAAPDPGAMPESPYPKKQIGAATEDDKKLIEMTVQAITSQAPNANEIIMAFINTFGEDAFKDLVTRVKGLGGQQQGAPGDGLSDSVPATIDGQQPAALSQGEYVVPSDVVSHLGNGDTNTGGKHLDQMISRVRQARGAPQPRAINPSQMMPM